MSYYSSTIALSYLVESDLITKVLATARIYSLPIAGNEMIFDRLIKIIVECLDLTSPLSLQQLGITAAVDKSNHREMIFQKVVIPSFIKIGPFHCPTLEFVLASPIVMAISSCLSIVEDDSQTRIELEFINSSLKEYKKQGPEVTQSGRRMMRALFLEGFEDTLEQRLKHGDYDVEMVRCCHSISKLLGANVEIPDH
ncbi:hypothetical protein BLNAU_7286 [Blattamonas nauphoetae]|uniref:Uncharacterized protein n=1 Tax=Blattamonas nauphoetae TaxID=2049346 RepID=A0ABQ9Y281_9EUKA|nr:hypothetical protein BLNAU_7286 [Blattamonas nauphoetae]